MLAIERRNKILELLQRDSQVVVNQLSALLNVTEETIRRDLEKLEKEGYAKKTYGGAVINENSIIALPYTIRKKANVTNKQEIAEIIGDLVEDGDSIMMDGSSTVVYVAKQLINKKNLTIITNSIEIFLDLSQITGWKVLCTGGESKDSNTLVGYQAEKMISSYHVDKAIISCKGIDIEKGITDSNEAETQIKKLMIDCSEKTILAVDHSKFDKISFTKVSNLSNIDVIVADTELDDKWQQTFQSMNIEYMYKNK